MSTQQVVLGNWNQLKGKVKETWGEFSDDQATDIAATLTYYAVLAIFPALLAFVSLVGLFGDSRSTTGGLP